MILRDDLKETLIDRFRHYLDSVDLDGDDEGAIHPEEDREGGDLFTLFVELAGLRNEVRTESRLVKEALDQFRGVFDTLQSSHAAMAQELQRSERAERERGRDLLRPLLLDILDIRDRLAAAVKNRPVRGERWYDGFRRKRQSEPDGSREGTSMTLRRLDQMLLSRRVMPIDMMGRPFDPKLGRVVATVEDPAMGNGIVVEEMRQGFLWEEELLRPAEVVVNKRATDKEMV